MIEIIRANIFNTATTAVHYLFPLHFSLYYQFAIMGIYSVFTWSFFMNATFDYLLVWQLLLKIYVLIY
jgi:hypothetical protein